MILNLPFYGLNRTVLPPGKQTSAGLVVEAVEVTLEWGEPLTLFLPQKTWELL